MTDTPEEKKEAARVRRRLLTLGELLAIAGVAISALALWNSYRERTDATSERVATEARTSKAAVTLSLKAVADEDGRKLTLAPRADDQSIQGQTITFPKALGLSAVETTGDARIERGWFQSALSEALEHGKSDKTSPGDARLPVLIATRFTVDGETHEDRALYAIGYSVGHAFLAGTTIKLRGLSRTAPVVSDKAGLAALEAQAKGKF